MSLVEFASAIVKNDAENGEENAESVEKSDGVAKVDDGTDDHKDALKVAGDCIGQRVCVAQRLECKDVLRCMTETGHHKETDQIEGRRVSLFRRIWDDLCGDLGACCGAFRSFKEQHQGDVDDERDGGCVERELSRIKVVDREESLAVDVLRSEDDCGREGETKSPDIKRRLCKGAQSHTKDDRNEGLKDPHARSFLQKQPRQDDREDGGSGLENVGSNETSVLI